MDKRLVERRFTKALPTYSDNASVQDYVAESLVGMLPEAGWSRVLEVGSGSGLLTRKFLDRYAPEVMYVNDLCPAAESYMADILDERVRFVAGDAEEISFPEHLDLIVSSSAIQWFNDLPTFFVKCSNALCEGGVLALSTYGEQNLKEIAYLENAGLDYISSNMLESMLSEEFDIVSMSEKTVELTFEHPVAVLRHLKETGVTATGGGVWTKGRLESFDRRYRENFSAGLSSDCCAGGVRLTYNPVWIVAVKKSFKQ
ncbi:MAG: malonyl-ACP O-methyltransferase BioC [Bacteroidales bacterium]|nr:malonyl-ACP O-methyltransferase BioC [Bacteroidales bacterium]